MNSKYQMKELFIEDLYVNPDNARFIIAEEIPDELSAIREIVCLNSDHVVNLAKDIASNGLNPNELPIVIFNQEVNRYIVMDGNRRISSIKLMTQYNDKMDIIGFNPSRAEVMNNLLFNNKKVMCTICEDEEYVNYLLEKLHTFKPGISQVKWDPQAQDRHRLKIGVISERLSIIKMLNHSKHTTPEAKAILNENGWFSKLQRFVSNKYISFFGIKFDSENNIILLIEESEVIKGLSKLIVDLKATKSDEIAQTEKARLDYLADFSIDKKPDLSKVVNPLIMFDVSKEEFIQTNIFNNSEVIEKSYVAGLNRNNNLEHIKSVRNVLLKQKSLSNLNIQKINDNDKDNLETDRLEVKKIDTNDKIRDSTKERTTLIPKEENITIKNQRVMDLYTELKIINVNIYTNVVSIALRSLIEFSINCYLEKKNNKWANDEKITLFDKLQKSLSILESNIGKKQLQLEMPDFYRYVKNYYTADNKANLNSIPFVNILINNHLYYPNALELKIIYNNCSPLLKNIWKEI